MKIESFEQVNEVLDALEANELIEGVNTKQIYQTIIESSLALAILYDGHKTLQEIEDWFSLVFESAKLNNIDDEKIEMTRAAVMVKNGYLKEAQDAYAKIICNQGVNLEENTHNYLLLRYGVEGEEASSFIAHYLSILHESIQNEDDRQIIETNIDCVTSSLGVIDQSAV